MNKRVSGFTLIELLVVITIIGILALLSIGGLKQVGRRAETVMCINSMRKVGAALHAFRADHEGWLPPGYPVGGHFGDLKAPPGGLPPRKPLHYYMVGYLVDIPLPQGKTGLDELTIRQLQDRTELPYCPSNMGGFSGWHDPATRMHRIWGSYAINAVLGSFRIDFFPPTIKKLEIVTESGTTKEVNVNLLNPERFDPARYPFLIEVRAYGPENTSPYSHHMGHMNQAIQGMGSWWSGESISDPGRSHGTGDALNFLFLAGNIETIPRNDDRDVTHGQKTWLVSANNPRGMFHSSGEVPNGIAGRNPGEKIYFPVGQISASTFKALYPHLSNFQHPD